MLLLLPLLQWLFGVDVAVLVVLLVFVEVLLEVCWKVCMIALLVGEIDFFSEIVGCCGERAKSGLS